MPRERLAVKRERAIEACTRMEALYPNAECALTYHDPFTLVICVALSAQTTDAAVNKVTPELFRRWPTPFDLAQADVNEVASVIKTIGFFRTKAQRIIEASRILVSEYGGEVPQTMEELTRLPGVGRKTANIVLNDAFDKVEGVAVDTHVHRICQRLKLSSKKQPLDCEQDILKIVPQKYWKSMNHVWVLFGREICDALRPKCGECPLADICPSVGIVPKTAKRKKRSTSAKSSRSSKASRSSS